MKTKIALLSGGLLLVVATGIFVTRRADNTANDPVVVQKKYIALGDSVAAGVGLPSASDTSACNRTDESYPYIIAQRENLQLTSYACSGATTTNGLLNGQNVNNLLVPAQISLLNSDEKPELITMTIGANDIAWVEMIQKCYTGMCGDSIDNDSIKTGLESLQNNLKGALDTIDKTYMDNKPRVAVTGYYRIFAQNTATECTERVGIDDSELTWIIQKTDDLNETIQKTVTLYTSASYVDINLTGHELCSAEPWIQRIDERAPFHPNETGQTYIAQTIIELTR